MNFLVKSPCHQLKPLKLRFAKRLLFSTIDNSDTKSVKKVRKPRRSVFSSRALTEEQLKQREAFLAFDRLCESKVDFERLTEAERTIHALHKEAVSRFELTYIDPESGNQASTRLKHYLRGKCCGSACRHCVYDHQNVVADRQGLKEFNSAFWIDIEKPEG